MAVKKILIVGNWKMYPKTLKEVGMFVSQFKKLAVPPNAEVVVAPPFPFIADIPTRAKIFRGAQDMHWEPEGAYTSAVSAPMLKSLGVSHVILGHSERRQYFGETDEMVNKKVCLAIKSKLHPIICVGENRRDHDGAFFNTVRVQIEHALHKVKKAEMSRVTIAYEPVWAVGAKKPATPKDANEMALFIRKIIADLYDVKIARGVRILYGGATDATNAKSFLEEREIVGLLVGRESREAKHFIPIILCAKDLS